MLLPLCAVRLLQQGQAEPGAALALTQTPAERRSAQAAAAPTGPATGGGHPGRRFLRQGLPLSRGW